MKKPVQRDLFPGALEMMILRILRRQPSHGYALVQLIKRTSHDLLQIEEGSLYPALQRLLKEELVKAEWGVSSTNRRIRIYKLTAAGAKHLASESMANCQKKFANTSQKKSTSWSPAEYPGKKQPTPHTANLEM